MSTLENQPLEAFLAGSLRVDATTHTIDPGGADVGVEPRIMAVLLRLAREPGRTVSRVDLLEAGWADAPYVSDESLTKAISDLRKSLSAADPETEYIRTVPKKGYLLAVPVRPVEAHPAISFWQGGDGQPDAGGYPDASAPSPQLAAKPLELHRLEQTVRRMRIAVAAVIVMITAAGSIWMLAPDEPQIRVRRVAVPASDIDPNSPHARVLVDTTFAAEQSAKEWLESRDGLLSGAEGGPILRKRVPRPADGATGG